MTKSQIQKTKKPENKSNNNEKNKKAKIKEAVAKIENKVRSQRSQAQQF